MPEGESGYHSEMKKADKNSKEKDGSASFLPGFQDVLDAAQGLRGQANRTPVMRSRMLDGQTGAQWFFKCENLQRAGAFKFRGAFNALSRLTPAQAQAGVVAYSSGNHAQAVALAGQVLGIRTTLVMPQDAPALKVAATRGYGGEIHFYDRYQEDREALARQYVEEQGKTLIPPYDHPHVIAGQGTAALELFEEVGALDDLFVPVGGGGLIAGSVLAARGRSPACRIWGVEPRAGDDARQSLHSGRIVHIAPPQTIADGAQTQHLGQYTFAIIQSGVEDILTATDAELVASMCFFFERMKWVVEPTACLAHAGAMKKVAQLQHRRIGVILSGGNVDLQNFIRLVQA